uniref:Thioredoxin n=1 Tax=Araucaria cunninghamii TaxID=56994 RepID=A0A0D6R946_ARACU
MSSFKTSVIEGSSSKLVVVDFFATWCGPCKAIAPTVVKMSNDAEYVDKVDFVKIDVDEAPDVAQEEGIRAMPTFGIYKDGQKVGEVVGADPRALKQKIDSFL